MRLAYFRKADVLVDDRRRRDSEFRHDRFMHNDQRSVMLGGRFGMHATCRVRSVHDAAAGIE